jgi:pimeloyl-ACP methyl ester carboxylesterase
MSFRKGVQRRLKDVKQHSLSYEIGSVAKSHHPILRTGSRRTYRFCTWLVNGYLWRDVVPPLSGRFRCIVPDWPLGSHRLPCKADADLDPPGQARIIAEFLSELNLNNVTLVGNNTGGAVCQLVVTTYPERIARLVLTNCDAYENFLPPTFRPLQWVARVPGLIFLVAQSMRLDGVRRLPMAFGALTIKPIPSAVLDEYLGPVIHDAKIQRDVRKILLGISSKYTLEAASKFS